MVVRTDLTIKTRNFNIFMSEILLSLFIKILKFKGDIMKIDFFGALNHVLTFPHHKHT